MSTDELKIQVEICNTGACTLSNIIFIEICDENEEQIDESIQVILDNVGIFPFILLINYNEYLN